jgi:hypothetical protein
MTGEEVSPYLKRCRVVTTHWPPIDPRAKIARAALFR